MAWHKSKDRRDGKLRGEMENSSAKDELQFKIFCEMCDPSGVAAPTKMPRPGQTSGCTLIRSGEL
jgi:hypothetical protein